ncbi:MAG: type II secretion system protein GspJ [bacterium]
MLLIKSKQDSIKESGFTLIEIMVATTIALMIVGSVYAAFRTSLKVYQRDEVRMIMLQRCRVALDRIAQDINNMFYAEDDQELTMITQDYADSETSLDLDMISFVTIVEPNLRDYIMTMENTGSMNITSETEQEEENQLPSDLARVVYFIVQNPDDPNAKSLVRVETNNLDPEELTDMLSEMQSSTTLSEELQEELRESILVDYVTALNIRYYDGTDWVDEWDMEEEGRLPSAVEVTLSITDADNKGNSLTQAIVVYLPFSKPSTEESNMMAGQMTR